MAKPILTKQQEAFCTKFVTTGNVYLAYKESFAGGASMKDSNIRNAAARLLKLPKVVARINQMRDRVSEIAEYGAADVVKHLKEIALADPNEIMSYRRTNCRYCAGRDYRYQWIDQQEFAQACADVIDNNARGPKFKKKMPTDDGGYGFNKNALPNPTCPRCFGHGIEAVHIADTRNLSASARKLYAGIKKTKDGIEVKTHSQEWALTMLAKHFRVIGPDTPTINVNTGLTQITEATIVPIDAQEAAKMYQTLMQGKKS